MRRRGIICGVVGLTGLVLVGLGVRWVRAGRAWERKFEAWLIDEPVRLEIDPSAAREYSVSFHQTCDIAHGQSFYVSPVSTTVDPSAFAAAAEAMELSVSATDAAGVVHECVLSGGWKDESAAPGDMVARMTPLRNGRYRLAIGVSAPEMTAPAVLTMRNELCGLERLPATVYTIAGWGSLVLGACAGVGASAGWGGLARSPVAPTPPVA